MPPNCCTREQMVDGMVILAAAEGDGNPAHTRWHAERIINATFDAAVSDGIIRLLAWCPEHHRSTCYRFTRDPEKPDGEDWFIAFMADHLLEFDFDAGCPWGDS